MYHWILLNKILFSLTCAKASDVFSATLLTLYLLFICKWGQLQLFFADAADVCDGYLDLTCLVRLQATGKGGQAGWPPAGVHRKVNKYSALPEQWLFWRVFFTMYLLNIFQSIGDKRKILLLFASLLQSTHTPEAESKEKHGVWDPMPELTITSPLMSTPESTPAHLPCMGNPLSEP